MNSNPPLNAAFELASDWPQLLSQAQQLAQSFSPGGHGRRRAGPGDVFWQFRPAQAGDALRSIDWRRSARADEQFVRENEWQAAQAVQFWIDNSAAMQFSSHGESKQHRAATIGLALAILLNQAGERVGTSDGALPPQTGRAQISALAQAVARRTSHDFGTPITTDLIPNSLAVFASDFFGDLAALRQRVTRAAALRVQGVLLMVLDPQELNFPFQGRTLFESMAGSLRHESQNADDLRPAYFQALEERQAQLANLAQHLGWQFFIHHTDQPASGALRDLYHALEYRR